MAEANRKNLCFGLAVTDAKDPMPECSVGIAYRDMPNDVAVQLEKLAAHPDILKPFHEALQAFLLKAVSLGESVISSSSKPKK